ncbi:MAG: hypothetical protein IKQ35_02980 [Bacilli bacterium]|nr:hypothetical protein [Bacilli bacterium]
MRRRDKRIEIYFNDVELNKLDNDREELGLSRSEYIRLLILRNKINKKNNKEILNATLELQNVKDYLKKIDTQIEKDGEINSYVQVVIKESLNNLNKTMEILNNKIE